MTETMKKWGTVAIVVLLVSAMMTGIMVTKLELDAQIKLEQQKTEQMRLESASGIRD